jgi:hypothetical protein
VTWRGLYTYSRRRNPSPSLTRSLPLVSPFQGCLKEPANSGQSPPRSPDRRWCLDQDLRRLATNQYEISGVKAVSPEVSWTASGTLSALASLSMRYTLPSLRLICLVPIGSPLTRLPFGKSTGEASQKAVFSFLHFILLYNSFKCYSSPDISY